MRRSSPGDAILQRKIINDESDNPLYEMEAFPGTAYATAGWRIKKHFWDGSTGAYLGLAWADGTEYFDKVADDYADYTYTPDPSA